MSDATLQLWPRMRRVERAAWNAIVRCVRAQKLAAVPLPVPVEQWIEGPLDIRFGVADLSHLGAATLGRSLPREREIQVSHALVDQDARFRFTAAHELGHVVLHAKIAPEFVEMDDRDWAEKKIEREADRFAAAFLMPIPSLAAELVAAAADVRCHVLDLLRALSRGDPAAEAAFRSTVLPRLARRFGVSRSAAALRFADVELPTGEAAIPFERAMGLVGSARTVEAGPTE